MLRGHNKVLVACNVWKCRAPCVSTIADGERANRGSASSEKPLAEAVGDAALACSGLVAQGSLETRLPPPMWERAAIPPAPLHLREAVGRALRGHHPHRAAGRAACESARGAARGAAGRSCGCPAQPVSSSSSSPERGAGWEAAARRPRARTASDSISIAARRRWQLRGWRQRQHARGQASGTPSVAGLSEAIPDAVRGREISSSVTYSARY